MNASAIGFELGSMGVTISSSDARSAVEFAVSGTGTEWALLLMLLLPGTLCCGAAALLVAFARWLRAKKTCSTLEDVVVQPLARDSLAGDASDDPPWPELAGYAGPASHGSASHGRAAGSSGAVVPVGLEMSLDCTVTNVGTNNMYRTMVVPDLTMVAGLHECTYTLRNSQQGRILLGVLRPSFDPRLDPETNAYDTPDAWLYGEPTLSLLHLRIRHEAIAHLAAFHLTATRRAVRRRKKWRPVPRREDRAVVRGTWRRDKRQGQDETGPCKWRVGGVSERRVAGRDDRGERLRLNILLRTCTTGTAPICLSAAWHGRLTR